jgi:hypothetical protein
MYATGRMVGNCGDGQAHMHSTTAYLLLQMPLREELAYIAALLCAPANLVLTALHALRLEGPRHEEKVASCLATHPETFLRGQVSAPFHQTKLSAAIHVLMPCISPFCRAVPTKRVAPEMARARRGGRAGCQRRPRTSFSSRCVPPFPSRHFFMCALVRALCAFLVNSGHVSGGREVQKQRLTRSRERRGQVVESRIECE